MDRFIALDQSDVEKRLASFRAPPNTSPQKEVRQIHIIFKFTFRC